VSGLALYIHQESAAFDPIKEIQRLKAENRRDDALEWVLNKHRLLSIANQVRWIGKNAINCINKKTLSYFPFNF
jgi:hypothetical protein